jgi:hypothetical protein
MTNSLYGGNMSGDDNFTTAFELHTWGYSVIPSGGGESSKQPLVEWADYQTGQPTDEQMSNWNDTLSPPFWGIVTNSTVAVIDADTPEVRMELEIELGEPHVVTPRKGGHFYINTIEHPMPTRTGILPGIDIRGEGGFVNIVGDGYEILTLPHHDTLIPYERIPERILSALNDRKPQIEPGQPIVEGQRNDTLARIAGAMRRQGMTQTEIEVALLVVNNSRCQPPLSDAEVRKIATSISQYSCNSGIYKTNNNSPDAAPTDTEYHKTVTENVTDIVTPLSKRMEDWVKQTSGWFDYSEIDREFGLISTTDKHNRFMILQRLKEKGIIEAHSSHNRLLRYVNTNIRLIDFKSAGRRTPLAVKYPFGVEKKFNTYPGNLIVVAGAADSGKTAFMLNFVKLNMYDFNIYYQSSEMGKEELASRLEKFEGIDLEDWDFTAEERSSNFADVIRPDCINIIDYLEFPGAEYNLTADYLRAIHERLSSGICLVALQKRRGAEEGQGGQLSVEKPRLYLLMDSGVLTIRKAKNWADPTKNPNWLSLKYKIVGGCQFIDIGEWHKPDE